MVHEHHSVSKGKLLNGRPLLANYRLLRAYANSKIEAAGKAVLARYAIPVYLDPEWSFVTSIWIWLKGLQ